MKMTTINKQPNYMEVRSKHAERFFITLNNAIGMDSKTKNRLFRMAIDLVEYEVYVPHYEGWIQENAEKMGYVRVENCALLGDREYKQLPIINPFDEKGICLGRPKLIR